MTIKELKEERSRLRHIQMKEYRTRGNTQRCQEIWYKIVNIDDQIRRIKEA